MLYYSLDKVSKHFLVFNFVVHAADIVDVDHATAVGVHLVKSFHNDGFTVSNHGATDSLILIKGKVAVAIEMFNKYLDLLVRKVGIVANKAIL